MPNYVHMDPMSSKEGGVSIRVIQYHKRINQKKNYGLTIFQISYHRKMWRQWRTDNPWLSSPPPILYPLKSVHFSTGYFCCLLVILIFCYFYFFFFYFFNFIFNFLNLFFSVDFFLFLLLFICFCVIEIF